MAIAALQSEIIAKLKLKPGILLKAKGLASPTMSFKFRKKYLLPALLFCTLPLAAQHHEPDPKAVSDSAQILNFQDVFTQGEVEGHLRNYFMSTWNEDELSDYYANAIGARLGFHTAPYHGFRFGFAGLFTYNAFSSNLAEPDEISGKLPRYELELFDIEEPENKADLDRLDELYLAYHSEKFRGTIGRMSFTSPLINPQDGRMKPYAVQGISVQIPVQKKGLFTLAWFDHFSSRSTVAWHKASKTIGVYPVGVDKNGMVSSYKSKVQTKGVAVAGFQLQPVKTISTEVWNYWLENISNTTYGRAIIEIRPHLFAGAEGLYQKKVGNGGNPEASLAYFPHQQAWLLGGRLAYEPANWHFSANYLHIGEAGRFLFPREFGREQFFVTMPRGRMEGLANADALTLKARRIWKKQLQTELAFTKTWFPTVSNFRNNKYGAEAYWNGVVDLNYKPEYLPLQGMSFRLLYIARLSPETEIPLKNMFYNTNFHHFNLVTQLTF